MKQTTYLLIALIAGMVSCNKDEEVLPLTPGLVTEIKAYDLDNNGNSSDIRLSFEVVNNLNVIEYKVMFIPYGAVDIFNEEKALEVAPESYFEIIPETFETEYGIKRLPAGLLDVNGTPIQNGIEYFIGVFVIGTGGQQLSDLSTPFILKDTGIYSGRYLVGSGRDGCGQGAVGFRWVQLTSFEGSNYSGTLVWSCPQCYPPGDIYYGQMSVTVENEAISLYAYNDPDYIQQHCDATGPGGTTVCVDLYACPRFETGAEGTITDDLVFEVAITFENCQSTCKGTRILTRVPDTEVL